MAVVIIFDATLPFPATSVNVQLKSSCSLSKKIHDKPYGTYLTSMSNCTHHAQCSHR
jgi:hypothetical protein